MTSQRMRLFAVALAVALIVLVIVLHLTGTLGPSGH
jgi:hypothetical protein